MEGGFDENGPCVDRFLDRQLVAEREGLDQSSRWFSRNQPGYFLGVFLDAAQRVTGTMASISFAQKLGFFRSWCGWASPSTSGSTNKEARSRASAIRSIRYGGPGACAVASASCSSRRWEISPASCSDCPAYSRILSALPSALLRCEHRFGFCAAARAAAAAPLPLAQRVGPMGPGYVPSPGDRAAVSRFRLRAIRFRAVHEPEFSARVPARGPLHHARRSALLLPDNVTASPWPPLGASRSAEGMEGDGGEGFAYRSFAITADGDTLEAPLGTIPPPPCATTHPYPPHPTPTPPTTPPPQTPPPHPTNPPPLPPPPPKPPTPTPLTHPSPPPPPPTPPPSFSPPEEGHLLPARSSPRNWGDPVDLEGARTLIFFFFEGFFRRFTVRSSE